MNKLGSVNPTLRKAFDREPFRSHLQEEWLVPKDHHQPGLLPTQKMMQEGLVNPVGQPRKICSAMYLQESLLTTLELIQISLIMTEARLTCVELQCIQFESCCRQRAGTGVVLCKRVSSFRAGTTHGLLACRQWQLWGMAPLRLKAGRR